MEEGGEKEGDAECSADIPLIVTRIKGSRSVNNKLPAVAHDPSPPSTRPYRAFSQHTAMAFRSPPAKVHSYVTKLLKANLIKEPPVWYPATTLSPPSPTLIRQRDHSGAKLDAQLPFEAKAEQAREKEAQQAREKEAAASGTPLPDTTTADLSSHNVPVRSSRSNKHLRFKTERPRKIVYPEDRLRRRFYEDHPWELRRPRCLIESTGDGTQRDWSSLLQKGRSISDLTGEE